MKWRQWLAQADRVQKSRPFKIAASALVIIAAVLVFSIYALQRGLDATESSLGANPANSTPDPSAATTDSHAASDTPTSDPTNPALARPESPSSAAPGVLNPDAVSLASNNSAVGVSGRAMTRLLAGREDLTSLAVTVSLIAGLTLVVVWLGFFLTHLAIAAVVLGIALPMTQFRGIATYGWMLVGVASLAWAFNVGLALLRLIYSAPSPVLAVARNVLAEAVRLKLSLLFIVLLMFLLATLPMLLDPQTPLRYRVQSFLQYSTGGAFWIIALLTLLFGVSTVTLEQRNKIIWQTMTKPVAPWQYILGKWLGVVGLNAILLLVCASGVFLFTEFLRSNRAMGESAAYVPLSPTETITEDRMILESQVLQARVTVRPEPDLRPDDPDFLAAVRSYIDGIKQTDPMFVAAETDAQRQAALDDMYSRMFDDLYKDQSNRLRSIEPGQGRPFQIPGLAFAAQNAEPLILRYKFDAGSNMPDQSYRVTIMVGNRYYMVRECSLGMFHALPIAPVIVLSAPGGGLPIGITASDPQFATFEAFAKQPDSGAVYLEAGDLIDPQGVLQIDFANGDATSQQVNPESMSFPPDGVEVSYPHGGYRANFVRVTLVLWVKLAFLAMLAITASTFLSFPVACMVALGTFLAAESSGFLSMALETFNFHDKQNNIVIGNYIIYGVASAIASLFQVYRDLDPIGKIVEGRLLAWSGVATGVAVLGGLTALLYAAAVLIFRKRELGTYSGQ